MSNPENPFILNLSREGEKIKISAFERTADEEQTLKHYEDNPVSITDIENLCKDIVNILNRANRRGDVSPEIVKDLKKAGQALFDEILTPKAKSALRSTTSEDLLLYIDDQLVQVPYELLFDGNEFLCLKFNMGRIVSTRQSLTGIQKRVAGSSAKMLIISDPQGNLKEAYKEGIKIRDELVGEEDNIKVNLATSNVDTQYIKKNIRDFDIIHYAGHADYNTETPSCSGWIMSNGKWTSSDISKMAGGAPLPSLVFSNACHSGRTGEWHVDKGFEEQIFGLANAFLLSGVTHYIGTFWEILDSPGSTFAIEFYKALSKNVSVGEAVRTARKKLIVQFGEGNIIWASYMLYGDPTYKIIQRETTVLSKENQKQMKIVKENPVTAQKHTQIRSPSESSKDELPPKPQKFNIKRPGPQPYGLPPGELTGKTCSKNKFLQCNTTKLLYGAVALLILLSIFVYTEYFKTKPTVSTTAEISKPAQETQQTILSSQEAASLELEINVIGQREDSDGSFSEVIVKEGSILHSYDNFQVHFKTSKDAYVYILIYDSTNKADLLFPDPKIPIDNKVKANTNYSIPSPDLWFWLDENVGIETLYILASENPLDDIKTLLIEMEGVNDQKKKEISNKIRNKIRGFERGVGGITQGKAKSFYLKDGKQIKKVTEIVKGRATVVRAISFRHIDRKGFNNINNLKKAGGKRINKEEPASESLSNLISRGEKAVNSVLSGRRTKSVNEIRIAESMRNIKKNLILKESRGSEGALVYKKAAPAVVLIVTNEGTGSGSILDRNGLILTNYHVVRGFERVVIFFKPEKGIELKKELAYAANVVKVDEISDLAILKIENPPDNLPTLKLATMETVEVAQDVHAIGHPGGEIWTYTKGIISQIRPAYEWTYSNKILHKSKVIQTQTPINPGNSGGPLLNDKAEISGINSFTKRGEGLNFAVSVDVIKEFIERKENRMAQKPQVADLLKDVTYYEYDLNKDGITDTVGIDSDNNGKVDMYLLDFNQDGEVDYIAMDENENGIIEAKGYDTNKNGKYDTWSYDTNEDGIDDLYGIDTDDNGTIDKYIEP